MKSRAKSSKITRKQDINNNFSNKNLLKNKEKENEENINDLANYNMEKTNTFSNFKNTIKTVRNEAEKAYFMDENFYKKRDTMDILFNNKGLPKIQEYEKIIQENLKKKPKIRKTYIDAEKNDEEEEENEEKKNKKDKKKDLLRHEINSFSKKKLTWTKEDFLREQSKKKDKNVLEETKKYLREVKEVQKQANKEESINQCISIFNKYLSEHNDFYKKKNNKMNKKIIKKK